MNDIDNALDDFSKINNTFADKVKKTFSSYFPYIILICNLLFNIGMELFETHLNNPLSWDFLLSYVSDVLTTMLVYSSFVAYAAKHSKQTLVGFKENCIKWSVMSAEIREKYSEQFCRYCVERVEEEREEKRREIIINHTLITYEQYKKEYRGKSFSYLYKEYKKGKITFNDFKNLVRANKNIKLKPINPLIILCGVKSHNINDAGRERFSTTATAIASKPIMMFISSFCVRMLSGAWVGLSDMGVVYEMICSALMLVISAVMGFSAGEGSTRKENDRIKSRIFYMETFNKYLKDKKNESQIKENSTVPVQS